MSGLLKWNLSYKFPNLEEKEKLQREEKKRTWRSPSWCLTQTWTSTLIHCDLKGHSAPVCFRLTTSWCDNSPSPGERCHQHNFSQWQTTLIQAKLLCHEKKIQHFNKAFWPILYRNKPSVSWPKYTPAHR